MDLVSQNKRIEHKIYERMLTYVLHKLGIGIGWNVQLSGEEVAFEFLFRQNSPLCVFDVGANVGSYASACLAYAGGGGKLS